MLTLLEALDELNSKSESELTLDYLEELAKKYLSKIHMQMQMQLRIYIVVVIWMDQAIGFRQEIPT